MNECQFCWFVPVIGFHYYYYYYAVFNAPHVCQSMTKSQAPYQCRLSNQYTNLSPPIGPAILSRHATEHVAPNSGTTWKNNNTIINTEFRSPKYLNDFLTPPKCRITQLLEGETEVLGNKNSEDFVNIVDGRVAKCILVVGRSVPYWREWIADHVKDRNICHHTITTHGKKRSTQLTMTKMRHQPLLSQTSFGNKWLSVIHYNLMEVIVLQNVAIQKPKHLKKQGTCGIVSSALMTTIVIPSSMTTADFLSVIA